jgi:hypothetical protein
VRKVAGTYYLFSTEVFDEPKNGSSSVGDMEKHDGFSFRKQRVIASTNKGLERQHLPHVALVAHDGI